MGGRHTANGTRSIAPRAGTLLVCGWLGSAAGAQVELRGGEEAPLAAATVSAVGAAGVTVGTPPTVIGWDRVKAVKGAMAEQAVPWMSVADAAWRARTRLERGDAVAAEPAFEQLFDTLRGERGPTAAVVAEGLLRCRVRRGAHVLAVEPWLAWLAATDSGSAGFHDTWASEAGLGAVMDGQTGLVPSLPPMWLAWPAVESYARASIAPKAAPTGARASPAKVIALAQLYRRAAEFEAGQPVEWTDIASTDPGVQLVSQIVAARVGDPERRGNARKALQERLRTLSHGRAEDGTTVSPPPWLEAWLHAAIGRSLVREDAPEQRQAGVLELLQLPARYSAAHPYLTGLALAESSVALRSMGDTAGADVLAREFVEKYATHPALDWAPFHVTIPRAPAPTLGTPPRSAS